MTDKEIIKGLECCLDYLVGTCLDCPYNGLNDGDVECFDNGKRDALDLIKRQQETIDAVIAAQETLQKYIAKQAAELDKLRTENAINADAYIKAVATFEAEKAEKERLLNNITNKERMVELFLKPFLSSQRADCFHCEGKSLKECEQCHAEHWADHIINYFLEGDKWQH